MACKPAAALAKATATVIRCPGTRNGDPPILADHPLMQDGRHQVQGAHLLRVASHALFETAEEEHAVRVWHVARCDDVRRRHYNRNPVLSLEPKRQNESQRGGPCAHHPAPPCAEGQSLVDSC